jgi:hypothetical protein
MAAVPVAVAGHLIKRNPGVFLPHGSAIVKMVTQMDHRIGLYGINAPPHKT